MTDAAIRSHYDIGGERSRLFRRGTPDVEYTRSLELLARLLPPPPARVLDVGGGPGTYAAPLARAGYQVHLLDLIPLHVEQAREAATADPAAGFSAELGNALDLPQETGSQDAVVLFGPLYHLTEAEDRLRALAEALRVLRPGGQVVVTAISRFASLIDGLYLDRLDDPEFRPIMERDIIDGQHRNPDPIGRPGFFTTAYFHTPDGLAAEIAQAGFGPAAVYGVEGPGWPMREQWNDPRLREQILFAARATETEPTILGFSPHLIAAAPRP
jgi:SAM-dependent methyltransferase